MSGTGATLLPGLVLFPRSDAGSTCSREITVRHVTGEKPEATSLFRRKYEFQVKAEQQLHCELSWTMSVSGNISSLVLVATLALKICSVVSSDGLILDASASAGGQVSPLNLPDPSVLNAPVFRAATEPIFSLNLLSSFPEDLEISGYCKELLNAFGERYVAYANCLVRAARPVTVCQSCFSDYGSLQATYQNISTDQVRAECMRGLLLLFH